MSRPRTLWQLRAAATEWQQPDPARRGGWNGKIEIIVLVVLVAALLVPVPGRFRAPWIASLQDLAHVPLFAILAWVLWRATSGRTIFAAIAALAIAVVAELLQTLVGRSASLADVARGTWGIAVFVGWTFAGKFFTGWRRRAAQLACLLIGVALPLVGAWPTFADAIESWREFPLLADFSSPWESRRWLADGCRLSCGTGSEGEGVGVLQCETGGSPSSSIILFPICRDWSSWRWLQVEFTVDGGPLPTTLSVRDGRRVTPPRRRFDQRDVYKDGRHRVSIDLDEIARGSNEVAPVDLSAVESVHFIVEPGDGSRVVHFHRIWLE